MGSSTIQPVATIDNSSTDWAKPSQGRPQDLEIDQLIAQGYDHLDKHDFLKACETWAHVWDQFMLRLSIKMTSCETTLPVYDGSFFLADWIQEYCAAMHNAALEHETWAKTGASFCSQVLLQFPDEEELLLENFTASHGEFLFLCGEVVEGEEVLTALIKNRPHRSVGYAYLADMFGEARFNVGKESPRNLDKAIAILHQGLAYPVEDAEDYGIDKRLAWFKEALGG